MQAEIPDIVRDYLDNKNLKLMRFEEINPVQVVKTAYLKKTDSYRAKDFSFEFDENASYYFFLANCKNPKYLEEVVRDQSPLFSIKSKEKIEKKDITLSFDYNRFEIHAVLIKVDGQRNREEAFLDHILNRENCSCNHATADGIKYYKVTKQIKPEKAKNRFDEFSLLIERYYMIEIEIKKSLCETNIKEDGVLNVIYLLTPEKNQITKLFTMVKYSVYFCEETLKNYVGKYVHDLLHEFTHLPSDILSEFLSHLGALNGKENINKAKLIFPLKKYIKTLQSIANKNVVHQIYRDLSNIVWPKAKDRIPFHKFIQMFEKYNEFYAEKEFKVKQKLVDDNKNYKFLKGSIIDDGAGTKTRKEHKVNLNNTLTFLFSNISEFFKEYLNNGEEKVCNMFMLDSLRKYIGQYTASKGFFNIDIVMNEDSMFEFQCCKNKKTNKAVNENLFGCLSKTLNFFNYFFEFNEGFFHKHFSILDYSYNFNEKNVIHTFPCIYDSSKKNKIRIFDILFTEKWSLHVATLILFLYREKFGFMKEEKEKNEEYYIKAQKVFLDLFSQVTKLISDELFINYGKVLPNYFDFCSGISKFPLDKYNCLDNLCQHFTNNAIQILIRNNIIFFSPFDVVYNIKDQYLFNKPNLNSVFEPYLILVDKTLQEYLDQKEHKQKYLKEIGMDDRTYFEKLKEINEEKIHYSVFLTDKIFDQSENKIYERNLDKIPESQCEKKTYDFYFLNNLSFYFIYETMQDIKEKFKDFDILKRYLASADSSVTISFHDYDKTIIQSGPKDIKSIKELKKKTKKKILKDLTLLRLFQNKARCLCYIFSKYVKGVVNDIITSESNQKLSKECFIKIGHYLVNLSLYENTEKNKDNNVHDFIEGDFYLNALNSIK